MCTEPQEWWVYPPQLNLVLILPDRCNCGCTYLTCQPSKRGLQSHCFITTRFLFLEYLYTQNRSDHYQMDKETSKKYLNFLIHMLRDYFLHTAVREIMLLVASFQFREKPCITKMNSNKECKWQKQDWAVKGLNQKMKQVKIYLWLPFWPQLPSGIYCCVLPTQSPPAPAGTILFSFIPSPAGIQKPPKLFIPGCLLKYWQPLSFPFILIFEHINMAS